MLRLEVNGQKLAVSFKHTAQEVELKSGKAVDRQITFATLYEETNEERQELYTAFMIVNPLKSVSKHNRRKEALGVLLRANVGKANRQVFWDAFQAEWGLK